MFANLIAYSLRPSIMLIAVARLTALQRTIGVGCGDGTSRWSPVRSWCTVFHVLIGVETQREKMADTHADTHFEDGDEMAKMLGEDVDERKNKAVRCDKMWLGGTWFYPVVDVETLFGHTRSYGASAVHASGEEHVLRQFIRRGSGTCRLLLIPFPQCTLSFKNRQEGVG